MKQKIRLMAVLWPILTIMCLEARAQSPEYSEAVPPGNIVDAELPISIEPIPVGNRVPADFWTHQHLIFQDGDTLRMSLDRDKGKLIILAFWSSSCAPCYTSMPHLDYFQKKYPEDLNVIFVNCVAKSKDDLPKISKLYKNGRFADLGLTSFSSIILDDYLLRLFPHKGYPYYVWINTAGVVQTLSFKNFLIKDEVPPFIKP